MVRGLYFCKRRKRWRVRLYDGHQHVIHLSYHKTREEALDTWLSAAAARQLQRSKETGVQQPPPTNNQGLIAFLRNGLAAPRLVEV